MLKIILSLKELHFAKLVAACEESLAICGAEQYPNMSGNIQMLRAEQAFYASLKMFFTQKDSFYAVWASGDVYVASLRVERYLDGFLIAGLETARDARCCGYATSLLREVTKYLSKCGCVKIYSHVHRKNLASLKVHEKCGFRRIMEYAVFLDGSVSRDSITYCYEC